MNVRIFKNLWFTVSNQVKFIRHKVPHNRKSVYNYLLYHHDKVSTKFGVSILNYLVEREELNNQVDEMVTVSLHLPT